MMKPFSKKILLASQSPRRKELLAGLGYGFEVVGISCEEIYPPDITIAEIAEYLAALKADAFGPVSKDQVLITADTIVAINGKVLGKPADEEQAVEMILELSGTKHEVFTGICIKSQNKTSQLTDRAEVFFDTITREEAEYYVVNFRPMDKAGSYGVQDWLGMAKIRKINGSFYTVMGLPTHLLYHALSDFT